MVWRIQLYRVRDALTATRVPGVKRGREMHVVGRRPDHSPWWPTVCLPGPRSRSPSRYDRADDTASLAPGFDIAVRLSDLLEGIAPACDGLEYALMGSSARTCNRFDRILAGTDVVRLSHGRGSSGIEGSSILSYR